MKSKIDPKQDIEEVLEMHHSDTSGKRLKRYLVMALVILTVTGLIVTFSTAGKSTVTKYKTEEVRREDLQVIVTATGTLQPTTTVSVGSEESGTVKSVAVTYNSRVKAGQLLARLDTTKLEAQLTQYQAALESARAKLLETRATVAETQAKLEQYHKVRKLSNGKVPSQLDMDAANASFERAKADAASAAATVAQELAEVKATETDLSKCIIRSPINGIVLTRSIDPGQTVAASLQASTVFTVAEDLTHLELHVNVDEADVGKIQEGQKATFKVSAYPDRTFEARIIQCRFGSSTTSGVVTYETVLKVDNADMTLRPGMTATADITVKKIANAILIPSSALRFVPPVQQEKKSSGGVLAALLPRPPSQDHQQRDTSAAGKSPRVWILKNDQLLPVSVTTGSANGGKTEIVGGGIQPGMLVAVDIISSDK